MKKTYINPTLTVVKINSMQLLSGSDPQLGGVYDPSSDPILSREADFDEEDVEDDFDMDEEGI